MKTEQMLLTKWRTLPQEKQKQVLELIEAFYSEESQVDLIASSQPKTPLGKQLKEIRAEIVASGETLLNWKILSVKEQKGKADFREMMSDQDIY
jgi:hypothetical protein